MNRNSAKNQRPIVAGLLLGLVGGAFAQQVPPQPVYGNVTPVEVPEWGTSDEQGNCQSIPGTTQVSCRYFSGAQQADIDLLDGAANLPGLQMKRTGLRFYGFPRGTPGTVEMRRFMFCSVSLDCSLPAATIYSHFIQPEQVYNDAGQLIANPNFVQFRSPSVARYIVDQGYNGFNVVLPIRRTIGNKVFEFCPSGTQEIRKWYNAAFQRSVSVPGYKNDGNWRFTNGFKWRDSALPRGYETSYDDEMFCGPAQAKSVWVNNGKPADRQTQADGTVQGSFVSRFDLASATRTNFVTTELNRSGSFDQSRNVYWASAKSTRLTLQIKGDTNLASNIDANFVSDRIGLLNDERTGNLMQMDTFFRGNRAWVLDHKLPVNNNPGIFIQPFTTTQSNNNQQVEAALAGRIEGDVFFRVLAENNFAGSRIEAWDLRTNTRLISYSLPLRLADLALPNSHRPEISYSPRRNTLYIVAVQSGLLITLDIGTGLYNQYQFPGNYGARDIEVDTAREVAYLVMRATFSGSNAANDTTGRSKVYEVNLANLVVSRQVEIGIGGWQLATAPVAGFMNLFITNTADGPGANEPDSLSQVTTSTFTEVRKLPTLDEPTAIHVQLVD